MVTDNDLAIIAESMPAIRTLPEPLQMFFELFFDTAHCVAASDRPDATQIHRRNYIRGIFAFIEGTTYIFKQYALSQSASKPGFYTEGELSFLRDEARDPHDKKPTPGRVKFARTDDNFKYGVNLLMRIWVPDYLIDTGGSGWQSFLKSLELRHRITHPKTLQGLTISDDEYKQAAAATEWVLLVICEIAVALVKYIEKEKSVEGQFSNTKLFRDLLEMIKTFGGAFKRAK